MDIVIDVHKIVKVVLLGMTVRLVTEKENLLSQMALV